MRISKSPVVWMLVGVPFLIAFGIKATLRVGDRAREGVLTPTGRFVQDSERVAQLQDAVLNGDLTPDLTRAVLKTSRSVVLFDIPKAKVLAEVSLKGGASLTGIAISPDGSSVVASNAGSDLRLLRLAGDTLTDAGAIALPQATVGGACYPCGVRFLNATTVAVAGNRDNSVSIVDLPAKKVLRRIAVDPAPYDIAVEDAHHLLVTCWAGPHRPDREVADSSGTKVDVDERGIVIGGSVCRVDLDQGAVTQRVLVPRQPTEIVKSKDRVYVACANGNQVAILDAESLRVRQRLIMRTAMGSAPNSLAVDPATNRLFVALGGLDRVGAFDLNATSSEDVVRSARYVRTGWYPSLVRWTPAGLLIATAKGIGSRGKDGPQHAVYDFTSSVSVVPTDPATMTADLHEVRLVDENPPTREQLNSLRRHMKHVVYVIKENRTYDQVLGDMKEGDGDPDLVMYGEKVTPNHHKIAREFVLLDNYYCNGILSADGHAWATEANATTFYEHSHGGWTRSYPFGDDPLATSESGYIWDDALAHGVSVRNFGEFDYAAVKGRLNEFDVLARFQKGEREEFGQSIGVKRLRLHSERDYPGWNLSIPDVLRADRFAHRLKELEKSGDMASLTIVYLPQDHTSGGEAGYPTPRAQVADNDQGLGRVLAAISHSRFWRDTVVFAEEDDPQNGYDHVDGHRSPCFVAGPYVKRGAVISNFYNQASVLHTMEWILGLPPMNLNDASAPIMAACFQDQPDFRPYDNAPNQIPLDERPTKPGHMGFNLSKPDQVDDDAFNARLWALSKPP